MNKSAIIFVLSFAITLCFARQAQAQNSTAVIRDLTGVVEIKPAGSSVWTPAKAGDIIEKQTIVTTGFRSSAVLIVGSSTLTVRPLTRLSLEELITLNQSETVNINLNTGRVRVEVKPPAGTRANFTVQSPASTASVRGTEFEMDTVSIQVIEGDVSYAPSTGPVTRPVTVSAGEESRVDTGTGSVIQPMAAEDSVRALPGLPGQSNVPVPESGRLEAGSLVFNLDVIMNK